MEREYVSYQQRVIDEKKELVDRLIGLEAFLVTETFNNLSVSEQELLISQYEIMKNYEEVLSKRIELF